MRRVSLVRSGFSRHLPYHCSELFDRWPAGWLALGQTISLASCYEAFRCRSRQSGSGKKRVSQPDLRPSFDTCCGESCPLPCLKPASKTVSLASQTFLLSILLGPIEPTWTLKLLPSLSFPREQKGGEPPTATDDSLVLLL